MFKQARLILKFIKGWILMVFKPDSAIVRSYVILILADKMTYDEIPNLFNLRDMVQQVLEG